MDAEYVKQVMETAAKMKKVMQKRGVRYAIATCPRCGELTLRGRLRGKKDHIHMACDNGCIQMME